MSRSRLANSRRGSRPRSSSLYIPTSNSPTMTGALTRLRANMGPKRVSAAFALPEEQLRIVPSPLRAPLPIFADDNSQPHAGAPVAILTSGPVFRHLLAQHLKSIRSDPPDWRRRWRPSPQLTRRCYFDGRRIDFDKLCPGWNTRLQHENRTNTSETVEPLPNTHPSSPQVESPSACSTIVAKLDPGCQKIETAGRTGRLEYGVRGGIGVQPEAGRRGRQANLPVCTSAMCHLQASKTPCGKWDRARLAVMADAFSSSLDTLCPGGAQPQASIREAVALPKTIPGIARPAAIPSVAGGLVYVERQVGLFRRCQRTRSGDNDDGKSDHDLGRHGRVSWLSCHSHLLGGYSHLVAVERRGKSA